jgi:hypothetical protein
MRCGHTERTSSTGASHVRSFSRWAGASGWSLDDEGGGVAVDRRVQSGDQYELHVSAAHDVVDGLGKGIASSSESTSTTTSPGRPFKGSGRTRRAVGRLRRACTPRAGSRRAATAMPSGAQRMRFGLPCCSREQPVQPDLLSAERSRSWTPLPLQRGAVQGVCRSDVGSLRFPRARALGTVDPVRAVQIGVKGPCYRWNGGWR